MPDAFPLLPISHEQLQRLVAALLVYRLYLQRKVPPTQERLRTFITLECLLQKLNLGLTTQEETLPLFLTEDDVSVIKAGFTTLLDQLKRKARPEKIKREVEQLQELKTLIEQTFKTVQD
jgi:cell division FtsZ-interacting protein ZapD